MKKHLCRPEDQDFFARKNMRTAHVAACNPTLRVYHHQNKTKNRRLNTKEIVEQMGKSNVCKACIRIVVVERLNGMRPPEKSKMKVDWESAAEGMAQKIATIGVSAKQAAANLGNFAATMQNAQDQDLGKVGGYTVGGVIVDDNNRHA